MTRSPQIVAANLITAMTLTQGPANPARGEVVHKTLVHDGIQRHYTLYIPSDYTTATNYPFVVSMQGLGATSDDQMQFSGMNTVAENEESIVAYPDAVNRDWFGGEDNVGFIDALAESVESEYTIDASRLYATGLSAGAVMSYVLGAARPHRFAAIAPVASHRFYVDGELFPPGVPAFPNRVLPMLQMLSDVDSFVPYEGGPGGPPFDDWIWPPIEEVVSDWVVHNGGVEPILPLSFTGLPDIDPNDGTTVDLFSCSDCATYEGLSGEERVAEVLFYRFNGSGHNWPGDYDGWPPEWEWAHPVNYDISASTEIWNFFSRHELPVPEPAAGTLLLTFVISLGVVRRRA